jgi:hypothetical protein
MQIEEVLEKIAEYSVHDREFKLTVRRGHDSKNGPQGSVKIVVRCRYGPPDGYRRNTKLVRTTEGAYRGHRKVSLDVENGRLPLCDASINRRFTPFISHIVGFNDEKVYH